jgi:hypothetical protein
MGWVPGHIKSAPPEMTRSASLSFRGERSESPEPINTTIQDEGGVRKRPGCPRHARTYWIAASAVIPGQPQAEPGT